MRQRLVNPGLIALAVCSAAPALSEVPGTAGTARTLKVEEAIALAIQNNPRMKAARAITVATEDQARSARGHLLPTVAVGVTYSDVNAKENLGVAQLLGNFLPQSGSGQGPRIPPEIPLRGLQAGFGTVTVAQPVTGLLHLGEDYAAAADQADAAGEDAKAQEADLRLQVETGFLTLFEARALIGIAKASRAQLQDQLQLTEAQLKAGVLTRADVLRVQVAVANADQQTIQAEVQEQVAKASLLTLVGLPPDSRDVEFAEPAELESRTVPSEFPAADRFAQEHRHEIASAADNASAAHHALLSTGFHFVPDVDASGTYMRLQGVPAGIPQDLFLIQVGLNWPVWQWGATLYQTRAASERHDAAVARVEGTRQQVSLEVDERMAEERAAAHAVSVAQEAINQAEEAYRVTQALVRAGSATTTDLLDAQSALTQARLNLVRARYQDLRARSALTRALGA